MIMSLDQIFEDATTAAGITFEGITHGAAWGDFNNDSYPDIFVGNHDSTVGNNAPNSVILYESQKDGTFINVAPLSINIYDELVGANSHDFHTQAWVDFDNDGDPDLILPEHSRRLPDRFLVNDEGYLTDQANEHGFIYSGSNSHSPIFFDYDQDGLIDIFVSANFSTEVPSTVFHQISNGEFENVGSIVLPEELLTTYGILGDLSGDGNLDLIISGGKFVYDITTQAFTDLTDSLFSTGGRGASDAVAGDFNGDLLVDLYQTRSGYGYTDANQTGPNGLDLSIAQPKDTEIGIEFNTLGELTITLLDPDLQSALDDIFIGENGLNPTGLKFTLDPEDPNVNGISDHVAGVDSGIYIGYDPSTQLWQVLASNETVREPALEIFSSETILNLNAIGFDPNRPPAEDKLYLNTGEGLRDVTRESGLSKILIHGRSVVSGDFDNDMDLDLYIVATKGITNLPNVLLENEGDGTFLAVTTAGGAPGPLDSVGSGDTAVVADYDLDGFLDLFITNGYRPREFTTDGPHQLYHNRGNNNHWLQIDLQGVQSNRDGIGAQVLATAGGVTQLREQNGGIHVESQNFQRLHFGLGSNSVVDEIEVRWPSGIIQRIENVATDQLIRIVEKDSSLGSLNGTPGNDVLDGTDADDTINGLGGNDFISAAAGSDFLNGNDGNDTLKGGMGSDFLLGGDGNDLSTGQKA